MRKNVLITLTLLMLIGAMPLLGACHTMAGAGQDISDREVQLAGSPPQFCLGKSFGAYGHPIS